MQIEDILSIVHWCQSLPEIGSSRIGLWGTSFGGCHLMAVAADNPEIGCLVSQLAFADGKQIVSGKMSAEEKSDFIATLNNMADKQAATGKALFVAITRMLNDEEPKTFFQQHNGNGYHNPLSHCTRDAERQTCSIGLPGELADAGCGGRK